MSYLRTVTEEEILERPMLSPMISAREAAEGIVNDVRYRGRAAVEEHAVRFGDVVAGEPLRVLERDALRSAYESLLPDVRGVLERTAERIRLFATAQREALQDVTIAVSGGVGGQRWVPVDVAGCYAPGGLYPYPSSLLMCAVVARAAGVRTVLCATPRPSALLCGAAYLAGVDQLLPVGGAQAMAALAFGSLGTPPSTVLVGPGNRYVTAAKAVLATERGIDMLAGPSELLIIADQTARADRIAADLLAQAEHDADVRPMLVLLDPALLEEVELQLGAQLADLPTADIAERALRNGFVAFAKDREEAVRLANALAPEHLELAVRDAQSWVNDVHNYGTLFVGEGSAEVFGDYGVGPNHVLPTGGTARFASGLSVLTFLRPRTWVELRTVTSELLDDAVALARLEGLEAHARAALRREQT